MAKKLPLLILTLTISTLATTVPKSTFAEGSPVAMWPLEEIAALKAEVDAEDELTCGNNVGCREVLRAERLSDDNDHIYLAVEEFSTSNFYVSAINPSAGTITLFLQDEDYISKRRGIDKRYSLTEVYMYWLDDTIGPLNDTVTICNYSEDVKNGTHVDGLHPLISKNEEKDGENWMPPYTEVQYSVGGSNLADNRNGILYFTAKAGRSIIGLKDYSTCINSPDYTEGMECRIMFKESGSYTYIPMPPRTITIPDEEPIPNPDEPTGETLVEPGQGAATETPESKETAEDAGANPELEIASMSHPVSRSLPKAPNTGAYPAEACSRGINMPWWIIVLILAGNALLIWWFTPNRRHSRQNPPKSPKKS